MKKRINTSRFAILGVLGTGNCTGYELRKEIAGRLGAFWQESFGQIYPELRRLEAAGLIRQVDDTGDRRRRVFQLTTEGRSALKEWYAATVKPRPQRDERLLKLVLGRRLWPAEFASQLDEYRTACVGELQHCLDTRSRLESAPNGSDVIRDRLVTLRLEEMIARAKIDWCDESWSSTSTDKPADEKIGRTIPRKGGLHDDADFPWLAES